MTDTQLDTTQLETTQRSTVNLRIATRDDVSGVMAVDAASYPTPWSRSLTLSELMAPNRVHVVAVVDDEILGHGGLMFLGDEAHVSTIAVHPNSRRLGVGAALVSTLIRSAKVAGCRAVTLEVRETNAAAISLYEQFGFRCDGRRKKYYADTGEDALIMWSPALDHEWADALAVPAGVALSEPLARLFASSGDSHE